MINKLPDVTADPSEPPYASLQREVQRMLGRCIFRLQQYEIQLKALLARQDLSGPPGELKNILAKNVAAVANKTLGQLVVEFTKDYIQPTLLPSGEIEQKDQPQDGGVNPNWFGLKFSFAISPEGHSAITEQLKELVALRNSLVHHFIERFDLMTEPGCSEANLYLRACYEKIDSHYLSLEQYAVVMDEAYVHAHAHMTSPEFKKSLDQAPRLDTSDESGQIRLAMKR